MPLSSTVCWRYVASYVVLWPSARYWRLCKVTVSLACAFEQSHSCFCGGLSTTGLKTQSLCSSREMGEMGTRVNTLFFLIILRHLALPANDNDMINLQWVPAVSHTTSKHIPYHLT